MKMNIKSLGLDPGNGYIKIGIDNTDVVIEPLILTDVTDVLIYNKYNFIVEFNGKQNIIGNDALNSGRKTHQLVGDNHISRYDEKFYKVLLAFILKNVAHGVKHISIDTIVFGVPNNIFKQVREKIEKEFSNTWNILCNNELVEINISKVKVVPQPLGTYFSKKEYQKDDVLIVDIGFGTVDYTRVNNGSIVANFGTNNGIKNILGVLKQYIEEAFAGLNIDTIALPKILETRKVKWGGELKPLDDKYINSIVNNQFNIIVDDIKEQLGAIAMFDKVIFTGGGSLEFEKQIKELSKSLNLKNIEIHSTPQTANVTGYLVIAKGIKNGN